MEEPDRIAEKSDNENKIVMYRRRLDRSPSHGFDTLQTNEKILISSLRTALEGAKKKVVKLRDENELKEDVIQEERQQRREVEEKLQKYLVDVYNNPKINSELRQRLPRAKNYDPLHINAVKNDESSPDKPIDPSISIFSDEDLEKQTLDPIIQANIAYGTASSIQSPGLNSAETALLSPISADQVTSVYCVPNQAPVAFLSADVTPSLDGDNHLPFISDGSTYPFLPHLTASTSSIGTPFSSSYLDLPQSGPGQTNDKIADRQPEAQSSPETALKVQSPLKDSPLLKEDKIPKDNMREPSSHIPVSIPMSSINYHYSHMYKPPTDNVSHITRFLAEISTLKKENQELKDQLREKQHDLDILKDELQAKDEGDKDGSVAALIEMVHSAGKKREQAMAQMVSSAAHDRDVALEEVDRMRLRMSEKSLPCTSVSNNDCSDLEETDENYAASGYISVTADQEDNMSETFDTDGERSIIELKSLITRQREIMQEEMKEVLRQRDQALAKVGKLEKRVLSFELSEFSSDVTESLRAKLRVAETQRDIAISKLRKISEDFGEVKLLNNLRQALVHDSDSKLKQTEKNRRTDSDKWDAVKNNNMTASLNKYAEANNKLEKKIVLLEHQNKEQSQQIEKLQGLIKRQRQKLNALCAGPLLIED